MMMDEDSSSTPYASWFDAGNDFPWRAPRAQQIRDRRAAMDGELIFDTLLASGGVQEPALLYPPRDAKSLHALLAAIDDAIGYDTLKKQSLIYYLLKWHQDDKKENEFKRQHCIPPQFSALADAYWHLDTGIHVGRAISILSDVRMKDNCPSKIIQAISLATEPGPLLRKYVRTAKPSLVEPRDLLRYLVALAENNFVEAWQYQRSFSDDDELRPRLFTRLVDWAIHPEPQAKALKDLLSLPLSNYEVSLLDDRATKPPEDFSAAAIARLQDLVCVRYIKLGKYADAIKMDRKFSSTVFDGKESADRRTMIRELYEALPPVEKSLIDMPLPEKVRPPRPEITGDKDRGMSLSQSWEEVRVPENLNKSTNTPLRNIQVPSVNGSPSLYGSPKNNGNSSFTFGGASMSISAGPAPLLPLSATTTPQASFTPRKNLTNSGSISASAKSRNGMSGVGSRLALSANQSISSPLSGLRFPLQPKTPGTVQATHGGFTPTPTKGVADAAGAANASVAPTPPVFKSTTNQANAFFQPKPVQQKRAFEEVEQSPERRDTRGSMRFGFNDNSDEDEDMEVEDTRTGDKRDNNVHDADERMPKWQTFGDSALDRSIFAAPLPPPTTTSAQSRYKAKTLSSNTSTSRKARRLSQGETSASVSGRRAANDTNGGAPQSISTTARRQERSSRDDTSISGRTKPSASAVKSSLSNETVSSKGPSARRQPPGAFAFGDEDPHTDDEHDRAPPAPQHAPRSVSDHVRSHDQEEQEQDEDDAAPRRRAARGQSKGKESAAAKPRGRVTRTSALKKEDLGRSIPGSFLGEEHHDTATDAEDEDHDRLAPLTSANSGRSTTTTTAAGRPARARKSVASRSQAGGSDIGAEDAAEQGGAAPATRRRSSRLTASTSMRALSPPRRESSSVPKTPRTARKAPRATGTATKKRKA